MSSIIEHATITPPPSMPILSRSELDRLSASADDPALRRLFRQCVLAVLNTGSDTDDPADLFSQYAAFKVALVPTSRGIAHLQPEGQHHGGHTRCGGGMAGKA